MPLIRRLQQQSQKPDIVIFCASQNSDIPEALDIDGAQFGFQLIVTYSEQGSSRQRNAGIDRLREATDLKNDDIVVFCDDDFVMREDWIEAAAQEFAADSNLMGLDGIVIADGVHKGSYSEEDALDILRKGVSHLKPTDSRSLGGPMSSLYGCNMVARASRLQAVSFDEGMPFYGWLEDYDFSVRLGQEGVLRRSPKMVGVHMGSTTTRSSGRRTGYTQISNPVYLYRKGTMSYREMTKYITKNLIINSLRSFAPEEFVDRRGRLYGNVHALLHLATKKLDPANVGTM